jgi:hypothetical protein
MGNKLIEILIISYVGGIALGIILLTNNSILPKAYHIKESSIAGWIATYVMVLLWPIPFFITSISKSLTLMLKVVKGIYPFMKNIGTLLKNSSVGCI